METKPSEAAKSFTEAAPSLQQNLDQNPLFLLDMITRALNCTSQLFKPVHYSVCLVTLDKVSTFRTLCNQQDKTNP